MSASSEVSRVASVPAGRQKRLHFDSPDTPTQASPSHTGSKVLRQLKPTVVFDTYWRFAADRQDVFFRRATGSPSPWTDDPIIQRFRFTNVYRASDRVSQYLIRNVIYKGEQTPREVFFRTLVFKFFNKIETWELLVRHFGMPVLSEFSVERYGQVLSTAIEAGIRIYSAAYIMPSGPKAWHHKRKHEFHLSLIAKMIDSNVPERIQESGTLRGAYAQLLAWPSLGPFLAYQFAIDLNYSELLNASEMETVVPGPGALDGISKCFAAPSLLAPADIIRAVVDHQVEEFDRLDLSFHTLWGRPLQLIDCQNIFCEISKYSRVRHPEVLGIMNRNRIKQKYRPSQGPLSYWFPPKWNLNSLIAESFHPKKSP